METSKKSGAGKLIVIILLILLILAAIVYWLLNRKGNEGSDVIKTDTTTESVDSISPEAPKPEQAQVNPVKVQYSDPTSLISDVRDSLTEADLSSFYAFYSKDDLGAEKVKALADFMERNKDSELKFRLLEELEFGKRSRWVISGKTAEEVHIDVARLADGTWGVADVNIVNLPEPSKIEPAADLGPSAQDVADKFVKDLLGLRFEDALAVVDGDSISDAQIAGLCIMFEEGKYGLNEKKPLTPLFERDGIAAFTVNLKAKDEDKKGQLELALQRNSVEEDWKVGELNIQKLLKDYIDRVADGDAYYTPIIKNPQGGDRLALYFDFNEGALSSRAQRQLQIIASLLKTDASNKLTLSGHADAIGSDGYNSALSLERAESVRKFLVAQGISDSQIKISAYGETQPRRDNATDLGRRANRRTEIFLDF